MIFRDTICNKATKLGRARLSVVSSASAGRRTMPRKPAIISRGSTRGGTPASIRRRHCSDLQQVLSADRQRPGDGCAPLKRGSAAPFGSRTGKKSPYLRSTTATRYRQGHESDGGWRIFRIVVWTNDGHVTLHATTDRPKLLYRYVSAELNTVPRAAAALNPTILDSAVQPRGASLVYAVILAHVW